FCAAELLANAAKHSSATRIGVRVTGREDTLVLVVSDDGTGGGGPPPGGRPGRPAGRGARGGGGRGAARPRGGAAPGAAPRALPLRMMIAETAALFRAGLVRLLEDRGHQVCAEVADGDALLAAVARWHPDVAVVDVRMPPAYTDEGLRAALRLRREQPRTAVL